MLDKSCPQTLPCALFFRIGFSKATILFALFLFSLNNLNAQRCNLGLGSDYSDPNSSCNEQSKNLGAGEYARMYLQKDVTYQFRLTSSGIAYYTTGICIESNSGGLTRTYKANRTGNHNIGTSRSYGFNYNSATLRYKAVDPSTPGSISGDRDVCSGASNVRYSISSTSNTQKYEWAMSSNNGSSYTTLTTNGGTFINVNWPNVVNAGRVRVRSINGPCQSSWRTISVAINAQPTAPTTASKSPNVSEVCMSSPVGLSSNASGGVNQSCSIYYRYTTDGGNVWSIPSLNRPVGISSRTPGLNSIQIQARRQNCSTTGCNTTSWNTVASWNVEVTAPVVATKNIDVYLNVGGSYSLPSNAVDNGSTDNCGIASFSVVPNTFDCINIGNNTVTLTVTDTAGNFSSSIATVNVIDTIAPTVLTQNIFIQLDSLGRDTITPSMIDNGTYDACGVDSIYLDKYNFDCNNLGKNIVTLTAIDIHGNSSSKTANVVVQDPIKPTLITRDTTLILDVNGNVKLTPDMIDGGTFDNCSFTLFTIPSSFTCNDLGPNTVLVIASDPASNVVFSSAVVNILDTISPTITAPPAMQVLADTACGAVISNLGTPTTADNCTVTSISNDAPAKFNIGLTTVTWTASDISGNSTIATQQVEVIDNIKPTISAPTAITVSIGSNCTLDSVDVNFQVNAADNCSISSLTNDGPSSYSLGSYFINWTAIDQAGNSQTIRQAVLVVDSTAPVIVLQPDVTVAANGNCSSTNVVLGQAAATDNCNLVSLTNNATGIYPLGVTEVKWTAVDASGNVGMATQLVTVTDQTAPVLTCVSGGPFNRNTDTGLCGYEVKGNEFTPTGSDNCSSVSFSHNIPSADSTTLAGVVLPLGSTDIVWTARDSSGNSSACTTQVVVNDTELPMIVGCPANQVLTTGQYSCGTTPNWNIPTASDNCGIATFSQTSGPLPTASLIPGSYTITYEAEDVNGNKATCSFNLQVIGSSAPIITCPAPIVGISTDTSNCYWTADYRIEPIQAVGSCPRVSWSITDPANATTNGTGSLIGHQFAIGTSTLVYTITDTNNVSASCTTTVNVVDNRKPVVTKPSDLTLYASSSCVISSPSLGTVTATDNCGILSTTNNAPVSFQLGKTTVMWEVEDTYGNKAFVNQIVTVLDTTAPSLVCSGSSFVRSTSVNCEYTAVNTEFDALATENCSLISLTHDYSSANSDTTLSGAIFTKGTTSVVWTAVDQSGNTSTCTIQIVVEDSLAPVFTSCPSDITIGSYTNCSNTDLWSVPTATDNCSAVSISQIAGPAPNASLNAGTYTVSYQAVDADLNADTCSFVITVNSTITPVIACKDTIIQSPTLNNGCTWISTPGSVTTNIAAGDCPRLLSWEIINPDSTIALGSDDASGYEFLSGTSTLTYTLSDSLNNTISCQTTIIVRDAELPMIVAPSDTLFYANASCEVNAPSLGNPFTADNCFVANVTNDAPSVFGIGSTIVTWTVADGNGNTAIDSQMVMVVDTTSPMIQQPLSVSVGTDSLCVRTSVNLGSLAYSDNCSIDTVFNNAPSFYSLGNNTVTWTVIDSSGNRSTIDQTVIVEDTVSPSIIAPADTMVAPNSGCFAVSVGLGTPITNDNCGIASVSNDAPAIFLQGSTTVTWTIVDNAGNTTTDTQNVLVVDTVKPTLSIPLDVTVNANNGCDATGVVLGNASGSDNCAIATITNNGLSTYPKGVTNVTWTATDVNGNITTAIQTVTVLDNSKPLMTAPANIVMAANTSCGATGVSLGSPIASDNCGTVTVSNDAPVTFPLGLTTVTWTGIDSVGNTTTGTQTVQVNDSTAPSITAPSAITLYTNNGCFVMNPTLGTPTTADNCTVSSVVNDAPTSFTVGTTIVTWTVEDAAGNTTTDTQNVLVVDTVKPTLSIPLDVTVNANNGCDATGVVLGNASGSDNCAIATITNNGLSTYPKGVTNVTWTATDVNGNITTAIQTVTVLDNSKPLMTAPANIVMAANTSCGATGVSLGSPIASDNCGTVTVSNDAPVTFPLGLTTVTWTGIDSVGNTTTGTQTVQVNDSTAPSITAPSAITLYTNNGCFVMNPTLGTPTTADNCTVSSVVNDAPTSFTVGTTIVTWTVEDAAGNTTTDTQNVLVVDTVKPTIIAPSNIALSVDSNCQVSGLALGRVITADNCAVDTVINNAPAVFNVGQTIVTWVVTDVNGNSASADQLITISDITPPVITAPADISVATNTGCSANGVVLGSPVATDNCAVTSITNNAPVTFPEGITTVVWTVVDANGNRSSAQQVVTVIDSTAPVLTPPADLVYNTNNGCFAVNVPLGTPIATDNCFLASLSNNAPTSYPIGNTTVTWTAVDVEGNSVSASQLVTIVDVQKPTLIVPSDIEVNSNLGCSSTNIDLGNPVVTDNCGIKSISNNAPTVYPLGQTTVVWTVEDSSGNITTDNQYVLVKDTIIPDAQFKDITVKLNADGSTYEITVADVDNGTTDNCGIQSIELSQYFFDCFDLGQNRVIATVIDNYGNEVDKSLIVTVVPSNEDKDFDGIDDACDDDVNVTVVRVPNGFTPNGDNFNDRFVIPGLGQYSQVELEIFNQFGNRVYQSKNYQNDWDGTSSESGAPLNDDTYFYVLTLDGKTTKQGYVYINRIR